MKLSQIRAILDAHFIPYFEEGGRIYADSMEGGTSLFEKVEDCTDWSVAQMRDWLGY